MIKRMKTEIPYFKDNTRVSSSSLGWFEKSPLYFRRKLDGDVSEDETPATRRGTMEHMYILQPDEFWSNYTILDFEVPRSSQQKQFAQYYIDSDAPSHELKAIEAFKLSYATERMSEDKVSSEALKMAHTVSTYIKYLEQGNDKIVISWSEFDSLKKMKENVTEHKMANKLIFDYGKPVSAFSEFQINWEYNGVPCKSLLDRVIFDEENKLVIIADVKTTFSTKEFADTVVRFNYYRQLAFYTLAVRYFIDNVLEQSSSEWTIEQYFIVIQAEDKYVKVIKVDYIEVLECMIEITFIVNEIKWHVENDLWDHTRLYYEGDGSEPMKVELKEAA